MKNLITLLSILILFSSCNKEEIVRTKITFPFYPDQETIIDFRVVALEDVTLELDDMIKEVNADYYNRYGIALNFVGESRESLSDEHKFEGRVFLPQNMEREKSKTITVYVIPQEYVYLDAFAYSVLQSNSIVLREDFQTNRTLAHELGHIFGLDHIRETNNVMRPGFYNIADQYDEPNDFMKAQIDTVMSNINLNFK